MAFLTLFHVLPSRKLAFTNESHLRCANLLQLLMLLTISHALVYLHAHSLLTSCTDSSFDIIRCRRLLVDHSTTIACLSTDVVLSNSPLQLFLNLSLALDCTCNEMRLHSHNHVQNFFFSLCLKHVFREMCRILVPPKAVFTLPTLPDASSCPCTHGIHCVVFLRYHIGRCLQWMRMLRVGLALQCEWASGRVRFASDALSAHICRLTYFFPLH